VSAYEARKTQDKWGFSATVPNQPINQPRKSFQKNKKLRQEKDKSANKPAHVSEPVLTLALRNLTKILPRKTRIHELSTEEQKKVSQCKMWSVMRDTRRE